MFSTSYGFFSPQVLFPIGFYLLKREMRAKRRQKITSEGIIS
jgi:hypothetical protein